MLHLLCIRYDESLRICVLVHISCVSFCVPVLLKATAIIHMVGISKLCSIMAVDNEEIALATANLFQCICDSLSGADKRIYGKEEALVLGKRKYVFIIIKTL